MEVGVNICSEIFCGCQSISQNFFTFLGDVQGQKQGLSTKLYAYILFMMVFIMVTIKLSLQWFIYKDYYPLKQKSPMLTIIMVTSICIQIIMYPLIYTINYFTFIYTDKFSRSYFRGLQTAIQFTVYSVYLMRCLRIAYAHDIDNTRRKTVIFRIFEKQQILAFFIILTCVLRLILPLVDPYILQIKINLNFAFGFEYAATGLSTSNQQDYFVIRSLVLGFIWQLILMYCMYLHKDVNYRYSMKKQIGLILSATQITNLIHLITLYQTLYESSTLQYLCNRFQYYPMTQFLRVANLLIAFVISVVLPLRKKKVYHVLLPTGPHYGFVKTMRNFLMQKQFLRVFSKYLEYLDQQQNVAHYSKLLEFWQQIILLKLTSHTQPQEQKLESIITLVQQLQTTNILSQHEDLINHLKGTINVLKDSIIQRQKQRSQQIEDSENQERDSIGNIRYNKRSFGRLNRDQIMQKERQQIQDLHDKKRDLQKQLNENRRMKFRESINDRIDELEQIALQKLNKIYLNKYVYTESYYHLKKIMNQYKKINLNLIMLNMALIVDAQNQFT